jgi:ABC-type multidrug transport system fused ATPase/permease subunit
VNLKVDLAQIAIVITSGGLALFRLLPSLNRIITYYTSLKVNTVSKDILLKEFKNSYIKNHLSNKSDESSKSINLKKEIKIKKLSFSYNNDSKVLNDINLNIQKGQSVAFVGKSGSGKTTLIDNLLGLLEDFDGDILIDDENIQNVLKEWQNSIGYIPQDVNLFNATIKENVAFGIELDEINIKKVYKALELAQLNDFIYKLKEGIEFNIGDKGKLLSGGQRQRLAIARALYHDPEILILDEATSSLDIETEQEFTKAIANISKSKTIIVIAHRLNTIKHCDVIHILDKGNLIASGSFEELKSKSEWFRLINESLD